MTRTRVHNRNTMFVDLDLVETKSMVAGPSLMQYLNKLFSIQTATGDIRQFESNNQDKYFMFSPNGTSDEIFKLK